MTARGSGGPKFEDVTETTGTPVSAEGAAMIYSRYSYAADVARGRRVLELGCGSGQGFGLVGQAATQLIGGDLSLPLLRAAQRHYGDRFSVALLSAEQLPFGEGHDFVLARNEHGHRTRVGAQRRRVIPLVAQDEAVDEGHVERSRARQSLPAENLGWLVYAEHRECGAILC